MAEALERAVPPAVDELAKQVLEEARERRLRLVAAESCTGGLLASLLTDIPGCSHLFERGFVTYSNEAKCELLGVPMALIEAESAVSEAVARAMAEGALARSGGDVAVAITGFTDSAAEGEEAGLVHFATARTGREILHRVEHFGPVGRAEVRLAALRVALQMLLERMTSSQ